MLLLRKSAQVQPSHVLLLCAWYWYWSPNIKSRQTAVILTNALLIKSSSAKPPFRNDGIAISLSLFHRETFYFGPLLVSMENIEILHSLSSLQAAAAAVQQSAFCAGPKLQLPHRGKSSCCAYRVFPWPALSPARRAGRFAKKTVDCPYVGPRPSWPRATE